MYSDVILKDVMQIVNEVLFAGKAATVPFPIAVLKTVLQEAQQAPSSGLMEIQKVKSNIQISPTVMHLTQKQFTLQTKKWAFTAAYLKTTQQTI